MNNLTIRTICAFLIGLILIVWPHVALIYLVSIVGSIFSICGIWSLFGYFITSRNKKKNFPIWGLCSLVFGIWLIVSPVMFVGILMYILGGLLFIAGIQQLYSLHNAKKWYDIPYYLYILPIIILLTSILIIINPFTAASIPFILLGIACFVYAISEIMNASKLSNIKDKYEN